MNFFYILLSFSFSFIKKKKKKKKEISCRIFFLCCLVLPYFYYMIECSVGLNCDQMEEGEHYSEYSVESNPRAYMTMRGYRNLAWQNQQPLGRNPNPIRSLRDYRDQWMSSPVYSVPSTYAPPVSPHFTSTPQPPQPPTPSPVEQAILKLSKLVDTFIEKQRVVTVQANQGINIVESSLNKKLDGFQSEIDQSKAHQLACSSRGRKSRRRVLD